MVESPARLSEALTDTVEADAYIRKIADEALEVEHVNDVIWELDASRDYDPSPCLGLIEAPLLAVNFADDELNPVELGGLKRAIGRVRRGRAITLRAGKDSFGHQTLAHAAIWQDCVRQLLEQKVETSLLC
jgi:homoserine O-acetyltransferase/O-succinyltransferase